MLPISCYIHLSSFLRVLSHFYTVKAKLNAKSRMCFFRPSFNSISDFEFGKKRLVQARVCSPVGQKWLRPTVYA